MYKAKPKRALSGFVTQKEQLFNRVVQYTDFLVIPQYYFDIDYIFKYHNTVFRYYLYISNLWCI